MLSLSSPGWKPGPAQTPRYPLGFLLLCAWAVTPAAAQGEFWEQLLLRSWPIQGKRSPATARLRVHVQTLHLWQGDSPRDDTVGMQGGDKSCHRFAVGHAHASGFAPGYVHCCRCGTSIRAGDPSSSSSSSSCPSPGLSEQCQLLRQDRSHLAARFPSPSE